MPILLGLVLKKKVSGIGMDTEPKGFQFLYYVCHFSIGISVPCSFLFYLLHVPVDLARFPPRFCPYKGFCVEVFPRDCL